MTTTKRVLGNEYVQTLLVALLVVLAVFGFLYGSKFVMHTKTLPIFIVSTGSMCVPYDRYCDGWSHPFAQTIHVGDLIIVQGVNPKDLNANYPNSDIIVFQDPNDPTGVPIVHRITSEVVQNGKYYFYTKGDGNPEIDENPPITWPNPVKPYLPDQGWYDPTFYNENPTIPRGSVPQDLVIGKVVTRVPWVGWITIYGGNLQDWFEQHGVNLGIPVIALLIALLIIVEFILPHMRKKPRAETPQKQTPDMEVNGRF